jgi:hypothetical protein
VIGVGFDEGVGDGVDVRLAIGDGASGGEPVTLSELDGSAALHAETMRMMDRAYAPRDLVPADMAHLDSRAVDSNTPVRRGYVRIRCQTPAIPTRPQRNNVGNQASIAKCRSS